MRTFRKSTKKEQSVLKFLNLLRDSGATNMFEATPYIMEEFPELDYENANNILSLWMFNFIDGSDYEQVEDPK